MQRCSWCGNDPVYISYHDTEWGVPEHNDQALYEKLCLDGFQAGLSWITVLKKRENFRSAFDGFEPKKVARYNKSKVKILLKNSGIIRSEAKIKAVIANARAWLEIMDHGQGSFNKFLWKHVSNQTIINQWEKESKIPASTAISEAMAKDLKHHGFAFVGPTICYAFMQAVGMVNDHVIECPRHIEVQSL